jgi:hypothetical protein
MSIVTKLYKQNGTPVSVRFGLALQLVLLKIKDWQLELKEIWAEHVKLDNSGVYEVPIDHGVACNCCSKIVTESYTHLTLAESKREKRPGRPRLRRERKCLTN